MMLKKVYRESRKCSLMIRMMVNSHNLDLILTQKYIKEQFTELENVRIYFQVDHI